MPRSPPISFLSLSLSFHSSFFLFSSSTIASAGLLPPSPFFRFARTRSVSCFGRDAAMYPPAVPGGYADRLKAARRWEKSELGGSDSLFSFTSESVARDDDTWCIHPRVLFYLGFFFPWRTPTTDQPSATNHRILPFFLPFQQQPSLHPFQQRRVRRIPASSLILRGTLPRERERERRASECSSPSRLELLAREWKMTPASLPPSGEGISVSRSGRRLLILSPSISLPFACARAIVVRPKGWNSRAISADISKQWRCRRDFAAIILFFKDSLFRLGLRANNYNFRYCGSSREENDIN